MTIPHVADDQLIETTWGNLVADTINELIRIRGLVRQVSQTADFSMVATSWGFTNGAVPDITLPAKVGDIIEYAPQVLTGSTGPTVSFDVQCVDSQTRFSRGPSTIDFGILGWRCGSGIEQQVSGSAYRTLVAGDVVGGNVKLRLIYRLDGSGARLLTTGNTNTYGQCWAINHGQTIT